MPGENYAREKKWAEARREEEEDFNLSPWFIIKPLPAVNFQSTYAFTFLLPTLKKYRQIPNNFNNIISQNFLQQKKPHNTNFSLKIITENAVSIFLSPTKANPDCF